MSVAIPKHMSGCPMHGGLPVPNVVATRKGRIELAPCTWQGFTHQTQWIPEDDAPDFGKYDEEKLRQCIAARYCHVCARPNERPALLCLPKHRAPEDEQVIPIGARAYPMVKQPWVCGPCLSFAVRHCPPLRAAIEEGRGLVAWVSDFRLVSTGWKPANPEDPVPPPGATVLSFIKIAIVKARYMPLPEWARKFEA